VSLGLNATPAFARANDKHPPRSDVVERTTTTNDRRAHAIAIAGSDEPPLAVRPMGDPNLEFDFNNEPNTFPDVA
jgi:hypothetical protein